MHKVADTAKPYEHINARSSAVLKLNAYLLHSRYEYISESTSSIPQIYFDR